MNDAMTAPEGNNRRSRDKKKHKVRFAPDGSPNKINAEVACLIPVRKDIPTDEFKSVWWSKHELEAMALSARSLCKYARGDMELSQHLIKSYEASGRIDPGHHEHDGTPPPPVFPTSGRQSKTAVNEIVTWSNNKWCYRGLETWSCYEHERDREKVHEDCVRAVLNEQRKLRNARGTRELNEVDNEAICLVSEKITRPARQFALVMGAADATIAGIEIYPKKENKMNRLKTLALTMRRFGKKKETAPKEQAAS